MPSKMIYVLPTRPDGRADLIRLMKQVLPGARAHDGCHGVSVHTAEGQDSHVLLFETWESKAHRDSYLASHTGSGFTDAIAPFLTSEPKVNWIEDHDV